MALQLKIEALRARGELTGEERDRLLRGLEGAPQPDRKGVFFTPLRSFLMGMVAGIGLAYGLWTLLL
jgi:hypothetical protein